MDRNATPRQVVWEVTARCDLACRFCYNVWTLPGRTPPNDGGPSGTREILSRLAEFRPRLRNLLLTGGEPLLRPDLADLVADAIRQIQGVRVTVATNGQTLTFPKALELRKAGVKALQTTLLSADPEVHDGLTGRPGSLDRTMAAIAQASRAGLRVAVFFVATRENVDGFPGAARLAAALGAGTLLFNRFQPGGRALAEWRALTPTPEQLSTALRQFREIRALGKTSLGTILPPCEVVPPLPAGYRPTACPRGTRGAYPAIGPDGALRPCNHSPETLGYLRDAPLAELLRSSATNAPCKPDLPGECRECAHAARCAGGCPAARELAGERIYGLRLP